MKILMVLTSHDAPVDSPGKIGSWRDEIAAPYRVFKNAGFRVAAASPRGGNARADAHRGPKPDSEAEAALRRVLALAEVDPGRCDAVFYPDGRGPWRDLAEDRASIALIEAMLSVGKPVAFVGHAAGTLARVRTADGAPFVRDRNVTGLPNSEAAAGLSGRVSFPVEDMLRLSGARYTKSADGQPHVVTDGLLITAQNSASSETAAWTLVRRLGFFSAKNFLSTVPWSTA